MIIALIIRSMRRCTKAGALCWTARVVSLAAGVGLFFLVRKVSFERGSGFDMPTLLLLLVPALIAWRAHLLGGIILAYVAAREIIYIGSASHPYDWERTDAILTMIPVAVVYFIGGVLHVAVCWAERREARHVPRRVSPGLAWAAGLIPLVIALFLSWRAGAELIRDFDPTAFVVLTPLIVSVIALRWHLVGGIAIVALSFAAVLSVWSEGEWALFFVLLFFTPFVFGGMLHILVWGLERQSKMSEKQAWQAGFGLTFRARECTTGPTGIASPHPWQARRQTVQER